MKIKKYISLKIISLFALYLLATPHKCLAVSRFNKINRMSYVLRRVPLRSTTRYRYTNRPFIRYSKTQKNYFNSYSIFCAALGIWAAHTLSFNEDIHTNYLSIKFMSATAESNSGYKANKFFEELDKMLLAAKNHLEVAAGMDCVIFVGPTGVGKSTLANAVCLGSDKMEEVKLPNKSSRFHGKSHENVCLVPSESITTRTGKKLFTTGSGKHSITSFPEVVAIENKVLADCPGFKDTGGGARDLMNCIAISKLLHKAKRVRLCFFISQNKITGNGDRGQAIDELLKMMIQLFQASEYEKISSDHLKKVQIVVTHLEGNKSKGYLQAELEDALRELLPDKQEAIMEMVENIMLVDAADRLSQFEDAGFFYSNDQTTVEELKKALFEAKDDKWFAPSDFGRPMTKEAGQALIKMCKEIREEAIDAIEGNSNYEARVAALLRPLKKFQDYKFDGIKVDRYIAEIERALTARRQNKEKDRIIRDLRQGMREAKKEFYEEAKEKGFFQRMGEGADTIVDGVYQVVGATKDFVDQAKDTVDGWFSNKN